MKTLLVGDLHTQASNFEDTKKLFSFIQETSIAHDVDVICFLGDLCHTHDILRLEIADFLYKMISNLRVNLNLSMKKKVSIVILSGNHDYVSPNNFTVSAIDVIFKDMKDDVILVSQQEPFIRNGYAYIPYMPKKVFEKTVANIDPDIILVTHQTVEGAKYESGFPAHDGTSLDKIPHKKVFAGHIHLKMTIDDRIFYLGTPRALTASDTNESKYIHVYDDFDDSLIALCTDRLVKCFKSYDIYEPQLDVSEIVIDPKDSVSINVYGTQSYYDQFIEKNKDLIGRVKIIPTLTKPMVSKIRTEKTASLYEMFEVYVKEVVGMDSNDNGEQSVWNEIKELISEQ